MNKCQRICILVTLVFLLIITFYPPWQIQTGSKTYILSRDFLFYKHLPDNPKAVKAFEEIKPPPAFVFLHYKRLCFEYSAIIINGALVFLLLKDKIK